MPLSYLETLVDLDHVVAHVSSICSALLILLLSCFDFELPLITGGHPDLLPIEAWSFLAHDCRDNRVLLGNERSSECIIIIEVNELPPVVHLDVIFAVTRILVIIIRIVVVLSIHVYLVLPLRVGVGILVIKLVITFLDVCFNLVSFLHDFEVANRTSIRFGNAHLVVLGLECAAQTHVFSLTLFGFCVDPLLSQLVNGQLHRLPTNQFILKYFDFLLFDAVDTYATLQGLLLDATALTPMNFLDFPFFWLLLIWIAIASFLEAVPVLVDEFSPTIWAFLVVVQD